VGESPRKQSSRGARSDRTAEMLLSCGSAGNQNATAIKTLLAGAERRGTGRGPRRCHEMAQIVPIRVGSNLDADAAAGGRRAAQEPIG
jgi:hypothetical protein